MMDYRCQNIHIHLFCKFPKNDALKNVWVNNMGLNGWKPKSSSVLCSRHFESHFLDPSEFCTRLRPGTIPTLFQEFSQPNEDLKNYNKHKLMNQEPILKPTATLCNIKRNALNLKDNGKQQRRVTQHNRSQKADEFTHPVEKEIKIEYIPEKDPLENVIDCKKERFSPLQDSEEENSDNKCHMFGSFVAQKLSQLSSKHRSIAQKRIGNILYELEMKEASCRTESGSETQSDIDDSGSEMSVSVKNEIESSSDFE